MKQLSRLMIAGTHSGVGKTTIATALMAAYRRRGLRVQGFKTGPDFIDPTFHSAATGRPGRNLDGWMLSRETNLSLFERCTTDADVAVIEGVMGLFDGAGPAGLSGSTAEMARWLGAPVILVLDAACMAASAAAVVKGFESFDPDVRIAGVLFNRVAGDGHFGYLREAVAANCRAEVLGYLPPNPAIELPERHLGLHLACEVLTEDRLTELCRWVEEHLDLELLRRLGATVGNEPLPDGRVSDQIVHQGVANSSSRPRVAVARDRAFCFYYQDNLDLLTSLGAELVEFSPIADRHLPCRVDGLYLGGGYPELHSAVLTANESMRAEIAAFARSGGPVYAECGGFMYLTQAIVDTEEHAFPMAGVFPTRVRMQARLAALSYVEVEGAEESGWLRPREHARGHEFRYSIAGEMPGHVARTYRSATPEGQRGMGYRMDAALAIYAHLYFLSCPKFAARFVGACAAHKEPACPD